MNQPCPVHKIEFDNVRRKQDEHDERIDKLADLVGRASESVIKLGVYIEEHTERFNRHDNERKKENQCLSKAIINIDKVLVELQQEHKNFNDHIEQGRTWRGAILGIILSILLSSGSIVWFASKVAAKVASNSKVCELAAKHIPADESRWEIFKMNEARK